MQPIGPAPVMSTSSPTRSNESAVCTALPNGSKQESTSSGIDGSACQQLSCGIATNSAHAPGRLTPTPCVFGQRCRRPARQLRQCPQVMCPSPTTRSPRANPFTWSPTASTTPTNSWPMVIGTGMVFCAQCVPVVDVHVRATDRRLQHADQHVIAADFWNRNILEPQTRLALWL